jgi:hypothetical protein
MTQYTYMQQIDPDTCREEDVKALIKRIRGEYSRNDLRAVPSLVNQIANWNRDPGDGDDEAASDDENEEADPLLEEPFLRLAAHYLTAWAIANSQNGLWEDVTDIGEQSLMIVTVPHMITDIVMYRVDFKIVDRLPNQLGLILYETRSRKDVIGARSEFYNAIVDFVQAYAFWLTIHTERPTMSFPYFGTTIPEIRWHEGDLG